MKWVGCLGKTDMDTIYTIVDRHLVVSRTKQLVPYYTLRNKVVHALHAHRHAKITDPSPRPQNGRPLFMTPVIKIVIEKKLPYQTLF